MALKLLRGKAEVKLDKVVLGSAVAAFGQPFLGILPMRDDPDPGVEVRYVYKDSPADKAGIKPGDRIMKVWIIGAPPKVPLRPITLGREQLITALEAYHARHQQYPRDLDLLVAEGLIESIPVIPSE